jgi:hypothetical protein
MNMNVTTMNGLLETVLTGVIRPHKGSTKLECKKPYPEGASGESINIKVDFSGLTVRQVLDIALRPLWISFQRPASQMTEAEYKSLEGRTLSALAMGKKPQTQVDVEAAYKVKFASKTPEEKAEELKMFLEASDAATQELIKKHLGL